MLPDSPNSSSLLAEREALERQLAALRAEFEAYKQQKDAALAAARTENEWLKKQLQRLHDQAKTPREKADPRQLQLVFEPIWRAMFDKVLGDTQEAPEQESDTPPATPPRRPKKHTPHGRARLPEHLPVETIVLEPGPLPAGAVRLANEVSWRLGYRPASYYRLRVIRPMYVVASSEATQVVDTHVTWDGAQPAPPDTEPSLAQETAIPVASDDSAKLPDDLSLTTVVSAPVPEQVVQRGLPLPDLLAHVMVGKFADKLPFHRQEKIFERQGIHITRGTMCGWLEACHELGKYLLDAMVQDSRAHADVIALDATGLLVQAKDKCKKGHVWVYIADREHVVFRYSAVHSGAEPKEYFEGFRGVILSDASNVYDALYNATDGPYESNCWAHARRYFYKALKSEHVNHALVGMGLCNKLFEIERDIAPLSSKKKQQERAKRSAVVVERLRLWKDALLLDPSVTAGTPLRAALNYVTNQWNGLTHFLSDGRVAIHNNGAERQLRSIVIGRANWLFVGSDESAEWTCTLATLVASAELHRLNPEAYLRDLFRVLPHWPKTRILELAPAFWIHTRAGLTPEQLAWPIGPLTIPPALDLDAIRSEGRRLRELEPSSG